MICPFYILMEFVPQNAKLLDIGCGAGLWLILLKKFGLIDNGVGAEVSSKKIEQANILKNGIDGLEFVKIAEDEKLPGGVFDCVSIIDVLHHVPKAEQRNFIMRLKSIKARRIIFKDIDPKRKFRAIMNSLHDLVLSRQLPRYIASEDVRRWFDDIGYNIIEAGSCTMLWYGHYYLVADKN
jgi:2-polyprenyl-3-methyl-5-hydroxy-6-metoxy-1,4-benzoquinol methylase